MSTTEVSPHYLAPIMQTVPAYTEATITMTNGTVVTGLARDMPTTDGSPRRWTVGGWEWFIDETTTTWAAIKSVELRLPVMEVFG